MGDPVLDVFPLTPEYIAGFVEVLRRSKIRPIMRFYLSKAPV